MTNFKNVRKVLIGVALTLLIFIFNNFTFAVNGKLKHIHGNVDWGFYKHGYAITESTAPENTLMNKITVSFNDNSGYTNVASTANSTYCKVTTNSLNGRTGSHYAYYYVDGKQVHKSTQAWKFSN
ncbi:hypothetical protein ACWOAQ_08260 [Helcococcus kunzii]|uniref:Uncharacterized protein n=2 Tax=Helcococcus kunzii TaxID=40091 RepID=H3NMN8_9FIRM|nr:hypothetical protein [Helcococcus kunzii]EHR34782.1 hypothetical protein HMPREF9709_00599 [Helcococcus kunzii ATCC 51366]MCT1796712.1 hypothetical protein [Helcococcus kunzii]MCT1989896.1 hypothetical protein [Helcococcus kunzii]QUY64544.1 hypothetical protein GUI37_03095 [Helcococcus kunzii]QZO76957.1 hypothetical protein HIF96_02755 [Helcococcus kunzii]